MISTDVGCFVASSEDIADQGPQQRTDQRSDPGHDNVQQQAGRFPNQRRPNKAADRAQQLTTDRASLGLGRMNQMPKNGAERAANADAARVQGVFPGSACEHADAVTRDLLRQAAGKAANR